MIQKQNGCVLVISGLIFIFIIVAIGALITMRFWKNTNPSIIDLLLVGSGIGISLVPILGYVVLSTVGYTAITMYLSLVAFLGLLVYFYVKERGIQFRLPEIKISQEKVNMLLLVSLPALFIMVLTFYFRIRSVLDAEALSAVDPWFWLYLVRYVLENGIIDYSVAEAYPMGFVMFTSMITILEPSFANVYDLMRFMGPVISVITALAIYAVFYRYFNQNWKMASMGALGFAAGNLLQFRGRMATPETIALYLFVIFLSYLYVYRQKSMFVTSILLVGIICYHPTTALVAVGIWFVTGLKIPNKEQLNDDIKNGMKQLSVIFILAIPVLIALLLNTDLLARYGFYGSSTGSLTSYPLRESLLQLDQVINYSLGPFIFGIAMFGVLQYIGGNRESKWAITGFLLCIMWAMSYFIPIVFFVYSAPRAATFIVFPAMIIVCEVLLRLQDSIQNISFNERTIIDKPKFRISFVLVLIISAQIAYGYSYVYINERKISDTDLHLMLWIDQSNFDDEVLFVFDNWITSGSGRALLYQKTLFGNDTLRQYNYLNISGVFDDYEENILYVLRTTEPAYSDLLGLGYDEIYNQLGNSIIRITYP